jgi:SAM-dependent methyltransferase
MLQTGKRMLVYGASWGYEVVQFTHAGLDATGFEVSTPRAKFGERLLGCRIYDREQDLVGLPPFDVCYASHVLEHLPAPQVALGLFAKVMASGSWLVVFVPNCGGKSAREKGVKWGPFSSEAHPMSYTSEFFKKALPSFGFCEVFCFSDPYEVSSMFRAGTPRQDGCLDGDELLVLARKS